MLLLARYTNLQLLKLQVDTLFLVNQQQRLLAVNEPEHPRAPRLFLGRSSEGTIWRFRFDLPPDAILQLEQLCQRKPHDPLLACLPDQDNDIRAVLARYAPIHNEYRGPAYVLPSFNSCPPGVILLSLEHVHLVQETFPWLVPWLSSAENGPVAAVVEHERAVSVCFCSRITLHAAEAGLETVPAYRGRGHGPRAVIAWAAVIQRSGRLALYSTSWDNQASQRVAGKVGAQFYGEDWSVA